MISTWNSSSEFPDLACSCCLDGSSVLHFSCRGQLDTSSITTPFLKHAPSLSSHLEAFFLLSILVCFTLFSHLLVDNFLKQMTVDSLARKQQQVGFTHEKLRINSFSASRHIPIVFLIDPRIFILASYHTTAEKAR